MNLLKDKNNKYYVFLHQLNEIILPLYSNINISLNNLVTLN